MTTVLRTQTGGDLNSLQYNFSNGKITITDTEQQICQVLDYKMTSNVIIINGSNSTETILANETFNVYYFNNQMIW